MNGNEKIYLSKEGYEQYLKEIEQIKERLKNNNVNRSEAYISAVGDGWHDNFDFEDANREEYKILGLLKDKLEGLSRIVIVDKVDDKSLVDINDYVMVELIFDEDDKEEFAFRLVASSNPDFNSEIEEISINSPLGKSVYQKKIGDKGNYKVNNNNISFVIINASKNYEELNSSLNENKKRGK